MPVITEIVGQLGDIDENCGIDPVVLNSEERAAAHFVTETASGRAVRVSLPRGTELQDGDVLEIHDDWAVVVRAAQEDLLLLSPGDSWIEWAAACYQLGNLHRPARFLDDGVLTPWDPLAMQILQGLDIKVAQVRRPFVGRRFGAANTHHHDHDHDHDHSHDHDHDHRHSHDDGKAGHAHGPLGTGVDT